MRTFKVLVAAAAAAVIVAPTPARADAYVSPWAAVQFGGKLPNIATLATASTGAVPASA